MNRITIGNAEELLVFLQTTELSFDNCLKVVNEYTQQPLIWMGEDSKDRLIEWVNENLDKINKRHELPLIEL